LYGYVFSALSLMLAGCGKPIILYQGGVLVQATIDHHHDNNDLHGFLCLTCNKAADKARRIVGLATYLIERGSYSLAPNQEIHMIQKPILALSTYGKATSKVKSRQAPACTFTCPDLDNPYVVDVRTDPVRKEAGY
jgi:hypothetical protein